MSAAGKKIPVLVSPVVVIAGADTVPAENVATPVAPRVVKLPAAAVLAPTIPSKLAALIRPLTPRPPVITAVPVVVEVLAVPAVKVVAPLADRVPVVREVRCVTASTTFVPLL